MTTAIAPRALPTAEEIALARESGRALSAFLQTRAQTPAAPSPARTCRVLRSSASARTGRNLSAVVTKKRCAVYTRVSTDEHLDKSLNSLDAKREAGRAFVKSHGHEGWIALPDGFDDGGFSGGSMERPALKRLLARVQAGTVDIIVVYKIDRLPRSLADFARLIELFEKHGMSFVSVTQQFNTTSSMGRLMLNILLSFAQFEREVTGKRSRDRSSGV